VTLFGDSGCFLPLYVAPFTDHQIQRIKRYQDHPDFIGVLCYSCIRKDKMVPSREGMKCRHCSAVYRWAYGLLTRQEAEEESARRYNRPLQQFTDRAGVTPRQWEQA
jgi:hypothetical protein